MQLKKESHFVMTTQFVIKACTSHASSWVLLAKLCSGRGEGHTQQYAHCNNDFIHEGIRRKKKKKRINLGSHALQSSAENRNDIATIHTARYAVCLSGKPIKAGTRVDERRTPGSTLQQSTWYVFDRR